MSHVTFLTHQDEVLLSDWKQHLERDMETLKAQSNVGSIRTVSTSQNVHLPIWSSKNLNVRLG